MNFEPPDPVSRNWFALQPGGRQRVAHGVSGMGERVPVLARRAILSARGCQSQRSVALRAVGACCTRPYPLTPSGLKKNSQPRQQSLQWPRLYFSFRAVEDSDPATRSREPIETKLVVAFTAATASLHLMIGSRHQAK